ncbi:alpha/beta fold hydrolase [Microbacterium pseudoresistens]|uniref:Pimeloyl-ACP methyl ester carboxylesterase n=1 Tax=Microbacterium pseudoresistens TaxID=640634 RepID=A0A7Y9JMF7_9MICO|nr:alpha/beta hydrolase [Microbacterium pseudoresistens]NYD53976.1 pimeloyl-ACP methyl ester carboxylesterase [Microbacterium pseudoresistens]
MSSATYTRREITHDGVTTTYVEAGNPAGGTVLLVHDGWYGADAETLWSSVIERLAEDYHVLAPDMLGFGGTSKTVHFDRPMYAYRAQHLGSFVRAVLPNGTSVHGAGTSLGGSLLLRASVSSGAPIPLASVLSISGSGGPWRSEFGAAELGRFEGTAADIERMLEHMAGEFPGRDEFVEARMRNVAAPGHVESMMVGSIKPPAGLQRPPAPAPAAWPAALAQVRVPTMVIGCDDDPLLEPGWEKNFEGISRLVTVGTLPARHAPSLDRPDEVSELICRHLVRSGAGVTQ